MSDLSNENTDSIISFKSISYTPETCGYQSSQSESAFKKPTPFFKNSITPDENNTNPKTQLIKEQITEVKDIVRNNIVRVIDREDQMSDLQDKTEDLGEGAALFGKRSKQLRKQMWWKKFKMQLIVAFSIILILLIIIIPLALRNN